MILFLFLILILMIVLIYVYYNKKISLLKNQLFLTTSQYNKLKEKYNSYCDENIEIKFKVPDWSSALLNINTSVFLAPSTSSPLVKKTNILMEVKLLDSAIINNSTWFYISLPMDGEYNCRGWIQDHNLTKFSANNILLK